MIPVNMFLLLTFVCISTPPHTHKVQTPHTQILPSRFYGSRSYFPTLYPFKLYSLLLGLYSRANKYKTLGSLSTGSFHLGLQNDADLPAKLISYRYLQKREPSPLQMSKQGKDRFLANPSTCCFVDFFLPLKKSILFRILKLSVNIRCA